MFNFKLGLLSLILVSCASRTEVANKNKSAQAVLTVGQSLLNSDPSPRVQMQISGNVILSEKCQFLNNRFGVEIRTPHSKKYLFVTEVSPESTYKFDVGLSFEGDIIIQLVNSKTNKIIESKTLKANKSNDRLIVDFNGCST